MNLRARRVVLIGDVVIADAPEDRVGTAAAVQGVVAAQSIDGVGKAGAGNVFSTGVGAVDGDGVGAGVEFIAARKCITEVEAGKAVGLVRADVDDEIGVAAARFVDG